MAGWGELYAPRGGSKWAARRGEPDRSFILGIAHDFVSRKNTSVFSVVH